MNTDTSFQPEPWHQWLQRLWRHHWQSERAAQRAVPDAVAALLAQQVHASEQRHTGQVMVCIEGALPPSYLWRAGRQLPLATAVRQRAMAWFGCLGVWDTEHNNGVLIYLQLAERRIEIVADRGLQRCMGAQDWQDTVDRLAVQLRAGRIEDGLTQALEEVSAQLLAHFPRTASGPHPNELPDRVLRV